MANITVLSPVGELEVVEEVDDLFEAGVAGEVGDVIADVPEAARLPVDVGDARLRGDDLAQPLLGHATRIVGRPSRTKRAAPDVRPPVP